MHLPPYGEVLRQPCASHRMGKSFGSHAPLTEWESLTAAMNILQNGKSYGSQAPPREWEVLPQSCTSHRMGSLTAAMNLPQNGKSYGSHAPHTKWESIMAVMHIPPYEVKPHSCVWLIASFFTGMLFINASCHARRIPLLVGQLNGFSTAHTE